MMEYIVIQVMNTTEMLIPQESKAVSLIQTLKSKDSSNERNTSCKLFLLMMEYKGIVWKTRLGRTLQPGSESTLAQNTHQRKQNLSEILVDLLLNSTCCANLEQPGSHLDWDLKAQTRVASRVWPAKLAVKEKCRGWLILCPFKIELLTYHPQNKDAHSVSHTISWAKSLGIDHMTLDALFV
jgi:hypothetical protein